MVRVHKGEVPGDNVVLRWVTAVLEAVRRSRLGPPMTARALAVVGTCAYGAWAAYDGRAVGTRVGPALRQPPARRTPANRARALSLAAYRAATDLWPESAALFDALMASLGHDPPTPPRTRPPPPESGTGRLGPSWSSATATGPTSWATATASRPTPTTPVTSR
jgi:hypothetical protein